MRMCQVFCGKIGLVDHCVDLGGERVEGVAEGGLRSIGGGQSGGQAGTQEAIVGSGKKQGDAQVLRVQTAGERCRTEKVREHHGGLCRLPEAHRIAALLRSLQRARWRWHRAACGDLRQIRHQDPSSPPRLA